MHTLMHTLMQNAAVVSIKAIKSTWKRLHRAVAGSILVSKFNGVFGKIIRCQQESKILLPVDGTCLSLSSEAFLDVSFPIILTPQFERRIRGERKRDLM